MTGTQIEVTKRPRAKPSWRLRDVAAGQFSALKRGRVHLPPTTAENKRVRDAVDDVLTSMAIAEAEK